MPFGRAKRADVDATTLRMKSKPAPADEASPDEQLTMPLGEDDTKRLDRN
jgi:hypothetical protein